MGSGARILVVEDDPVVAMDLEIRLSKLGYAVVASSASGPEALRKAEELRPELALMDIHIRGDMDGIETADALRRRFGIPVIYVTAHSDSATLERAKVTEAFGFILKPIEDRDLHTSVEMALYKHKMEEKLRRVERFLSTTLRSIGDGVIATDLGGFVSFLNPMGTQITGWSLEDALGKPVDEIFCLVRGPNRISAESVVLQVLRDEVITELAPDSILIKRNGEEVAVEDSAAPLREEDGRLIGAVIVFRDVTQRRKIEKQLADSRERLRQAEKMESIGRLAGGVAHDFNNLLTVIVGYSDLLRKTSSVAPDGRAYLDEVSLAAQRATDLTRQLLAYSRKQTLLPSIVDLNRKIEGLRRLLQHLLTADIMVEIRLSPTLKSVLVDSSQIEQVLVNLAANARDAMPRGGRLVLETSNMTLDQDAARGFELSPGSYVCLSVQDSGMGMDKATQAQIFEPFFTTKPLGQGAGLGLATVFGIVKQSKGHIKVYSEPGHGATFKIFLPAIPNMDAELPVPHTPVQLPHGKEQLLIIDDNDLIRKYLKSVLGELGYMIHEASGAKEAIQIAENQAFDLDAVITDIVMPEINGLDLVKELLKLRPSLRILYMSGYSEMSVARYGVLGLGAEFIQKPFTAASIATKLRSVLDSPSLTGEESGTAE